MKESVMKVTGRESINGLQHEIGRDVGGVVR